MRCAQQPHFESSALFIWSLPLSIQHNSTSGGFDIATSFFVSAVKSASHGSRDGAFFLAEAVKGGTHAVFVATASAVLQHRRFRSTTSSSFFFETVVTILLLLLPQCVGSCSLFGGAAVGEARKCVRAVCQHGQRVRGERFAHGQRVQALDLALREEGQHVAQVAPQKVERRRVRPVHRLAEVNHVHHFAAAAACLPLQQQVVLAQVSVHQVRALKQGPHARQRLQVAPPPRFRGEAGLRHAVQLRRGGPAVGTATRTLRAQAMAQAPSVAAHDTAGAVLLATVATIFEQGWALTHSF
mmetsp:Transcript_45957/g.90696  ORF Transcript_45957/g.90696 Transcript_45957/m.90696 type:complete len:298 (-) Transcript_45957:63-956(-)